MKTNDIWTIIPSGGEGVRLRPFTSERSKPMVPLTNNFPILEILLYSLALEGELRNFIFGVKGVKHYTNIHNYFQGGFGWGSKLGFNPSVNFEYQYPHYQDTGSADSVLFNIKNFEIDETIIVLPCDNLISGADVISAYQHSISTEYPLTILLTNFHDVSQFGLAEYDRSSTQIKSFVEKPSHLASHPGLINTGTYIIKPSAFKYLQGDFGKDVIPEMTKNGLVGGYVIKNEWYDFGNPNVHLESVLNLLKKPTHSFSEFLRRICTIYEDGESKVYIRGRGDESLKRSKETINKILQGKIKVNGTVFIGKNCDIDDGAYLENCSIGDFSKIGKHAMVVDSNLLDVWAIGSESIITGTFGGRGVQIGTGCILKNCYIGDDSIIKNECRLTNVSTKNSSRIPSFQKLKNINGELVV